jgi:HlyD family secretion protein
MKKIIFILVTIFAVVTVILFLNNRASDHQEFETCSVQPQTIAMTVTATGQIEPTITVQVSTQISGILKEIPVDYNSTVKTGDLLAQLDPETYQASLDQAKGELSSAQAGLELAEVNEKRKKELLASKMLPQADYDKALADLHQAQAEYSIREAMLKRAMIDIGRCKIISPVDGIVIKRNVDVGQTVAASLNAPDLFEIAKDLTMMQIHTFVSESDIGKIKEKMSAEFTVDAYPDEAFHGEVVQIRNAPQTVDNVVTYETLINVSNPDFRLKPGMSANVTLIIEKKENVLSVQNSAFRFEPPASLFTPIKKKGEFSGTGKQAEGNGAGATGTQKSWQGKGHAKENGNEGEAPAKTPRKSLYLLKEGKIQKVRVKTGISNNFYTEILEGVQEGDPVILRIKSGQTSSSNTTAKNPFMPQRPPGGGQGR